MSDESVIAECEEYVAREGERIEAELQAAEVLWSLWYSLADGGHLLSKALIYQLVHKYGPQPVHNIFESVAPKVNSGKLKTKEDREKYIWGALRRNAAQQ